MRSAYDSIVLITSLEVDVAAFEAATGWAVKPEGACRGDVCVPLPQASRIDDNHVRVDAVAERLGAPLVHDDAHGVWAVGPSTLGGRALATAEAAELELPDLDGNVFKLSSLRGQKVLLVAWASW
jgi:hypothetical protein